MSVLGQFFSIRSAIDTRFYKSSYPDVAQSSQSAYYHYCNYGWKEGRKPSRGFDTIWYLHCNHDVLDHGINPLTHYLKHGVYEGREPIKPDNLDLLDVYADVENDEKMSKAIHLFCNSYRIVAESGYFDPVYYTQMQEQFDGDPLEHFIRCGWMGKTNPGPKL